MLLLLPRKLPRFHGSFHELPPKMQVAQVALFTAKYFLQFHATLGINSKAQQTCWRFIPGVVVVVVLTLTRIIKSVVTGLLLTGSYTTRSML